MSWHNHSRTCQNNTTSQIGLSSLDPKSPAVGSCVYRLQRVDLRGVEPRTSRQMLVRQDGFRVGRLQTGKLVGGGLVVDARRGEEGVAVEEG